MHKRNRQIILYEKGEDNIEAYFRAIDCLLNDKEHSVLNIAFSIFGKTGLDVKIDACKKSKILKYQITKKRS